ncbi:MAG: D-alanyl-D-alanine carboxypeptidase family protein [Pyrinomonadaceae bacterium]
MIKSKREFLIVTCLVAALLVAAAALAMPGYTQSAGDNRAAQEATRERIVAAANRTTEPGTPIDATKAAGTSDASPSRATIVTDAGASTELAAAAKQNLLLRDGMDWVFGGKSQHGWSLYEPLITRTLAARDGAQTNNFANAVSRWQASTGLHSSGVLDRDSWMKMVEGWQSNRLKERAYATPDQLVTVSAAEFYDPARPAELRQVERTTYAAYRRLLAAAAADKSLGLQLTPNGDLADGEKFLKIVSAFRPREYQERLRREQPGAGRAALAVHSPHFTGRALDLYVGGYDPVSTKDDNRALQTQTQAYRWLVQNADRFGFRPYYFEPWHWEYVGN